MILIADGGSTKTSWVLTDKAGTIQEFMSSGFNPYIQSKELISKTIMTEIFPKTKGFDIESLYFYGAGCSTEANKKIMSDCFKSYFIKSDIEIEHDMLGAARALWFDETGIAVILGTGSNACLYDGEEIIDDNLDSLGYILGDEGSGAYMGKILIRDYFYYRMPENLREKMRLQYKLELGPVLDHVYKMENPNRWLASFAVFISENIDNDYCRQLALNNFRNFFEINIMQFNPKRAYSIGVAGSIGFYFRNCLEIVSQEYGFNLKKVIKSPIKELVKYHLQHNEI